MLHYESQDIQNEQFKALSTSKEFQAIFPEVFEDGVVDDMVYAATVAARERASVLKAQLERILATETV